MVDTIKKSINVTNVWVGVVCRTYIFNWYTDQNHRKSPLTTELGGHALREGYTKNKTTRQYTAQKKSEKNINILNIVFSYYNN